MRTLRSSISRVASFAIGALMRYELRAQSVSRANNRGGSRILEEVDGGWRMVELDEAHACTP